MNCRPRRSVAHLVGTVLECQQSWRRRRCLWLCKTAHIRRTGLGPHGWTGQCRRRQHAGDLFRRPALRLPPGGSSGPPGPDPGRLEVGRSRRASFPALGRRWSGPRPRRGRRRTREARTPRSLGIPWAPACGRGSGRWVSDGRGPRRGSGPFVGRQILPPAVVDQLGGRATAHGAPSGQALVREAALEVAAHLQSGALARADHLKRFVVGLVACVGGAAPRRASATKRHTVPCSRRRP